MEPDRRCAHCGQTIPWGEIECPHCSEHHTYFWALRRETFNLLVLTLLILFFVITGIVVRGYQRMEKRIAEDWNRRGEAELTAARPAAALTDFRNAVFHARDNALYQLRLAQALAETGQFQQAKNYLLALRESDPGSGPVNLELARLAVRERSIPDALRYFHDAVYCEWAGDPVAMRRAVRLELVKFLLDSDERTTARAELVAVAANLPPDPSMQTHVGTLLVKAGDYDDALRLFRQALAEEPHSAPALAGAGECYFQTGDYAQAQRYLERALLADPHLTIAAETLETTRAVLNLNPFTRRLEQQERARRATQAFDLATQRLEACAARRGIDLKVAGGNPLQSLQAEVTGMQPRIRMSAFRRDPALLFNIMDVVFEIEKAAAQSCGEPQGQDLALLIIAKQQEGGKP